MATPELSAEEAINAALRYGYDAVSLRMHEICGEVMLNSSNEELHKIRNLFSDSGIIQGALMCYNDMQPSSEECSRYTFEYALKAMENAAEAGAKSIRLFGDGIHLDAFCDAISKAIEKSQTGINVFIQNHPGNADYSEIVNSICKINNTGLIFSPEYINEKEVYGVCKEVIPFIKEVYATNKITTDGIVKHVSLSEGDYDWRKLYKILANEGFDDILYIKWERVWHRALAPYSVILPKEKQFFDELKAMYETRA